MGKKKNRGGHRDEGGPRAMATATGSSGGKLEKRKKKKKKTTAVERAGSGGGGNAKKPTTTTASHRPTKPLLRAAPPPPSYRLRGTSGSDDDDDDAAPSFLTPSHAEYERCMKTSYLGFHVDDPSALPEKTHREIARAFERMASDGIFHRDVLAAGKSVSPTFVSRTLLGERGMTYHYQRLRIFAHPWDEETQPDASHPFRAVKRLNDALVSRSTAVLRASSDPRLGDGVDGSCDFNVTLINLMEPASRCAEVPLKDEALFGMGKTSVSWHSDSSLQDVSTVAVYHQTDDDDDDSWAVALKTLDGVTPAMRTPLRSREMYYMLRDFNAHHHHAVITGESRRFSSTHRVAVVAKDTFEHIKTRCERALRLLPGIKKIAQVGPGPGDDLAAFARSAQMMGETHRECEFQWIRMFWLQGSRHAASHSAYWRQRIAELTQAWDAMELGYRWALDALRAGASTGAMPLRAYDVVSYLLEETRELRAEHARRSRAGAYEAMPADCRPVDEPKFDEKSPLPFDLGPVLATLAGWRRDAERAQTTTTEGGSKTKKGKPGKGSKRR